MIPKCLRGTKTYITLSKPLRGRIWFEGRNLIIIAIKNHNHNHNLLLQVWNSQNLHNLLCQWQDTFLESKFLCNSENWSIFFSQLCWFCSILFWNSIVLDSGKILYSMRLATNVRLPWSLLFSAWLLQQIEKRKNRNQEGKGQEKKRRKQKAIPRIVLLWYQLLWHGYSQWSTKENGEEGEGTEGDREGGELGKDANYID